MSNQGPKTLFDKIWSEHLVGQREDGTSLLYIDRHLVHEVTSPQAFEGLKISNRPVHRPEATIAVADHNVPTINRQNIEDPQSKKLQSRRFSRKNECKIVQISFIRNH